MHEPLPPSVLKGLALYYVVVAVLNVGYAVYHIRQRNRPQSLLWLLVAGAFVAHAFAYLGGASLVIPEGLTHFVDSVTNAVSYFVLSTVAFIVLLVFRKPLTAPPVAWGLMNVALLAFGWALTNDDFRSIVAKEDNVPIVMLITFVGFFTWLAL